MKGSRIGTTTLRLPDEKIRLIRAISGYENIPLCKIFEGLTDEDIQRYRETREILEKQGFLESGLTALAEIRERGGLPSVILIPIVSPHICCLGKSKNWDRIHPAR